MLSPLTKEQWMKVEENMGLVGKVIQDCVHTLGAGSMFDYDDLFQIGCLGLCKAAQTDKPPAGSAASWPSTSPSGAASRPTTTSGRRRMRSSTDRQKPPQTEIKSPRLRWAKEWRKSRQNCVFSLTICRHPVIISL